MPAQPTPFFAPGYMVSRSKNLADQQCINLYPEIVETKSGKAVGAFYMCPGLVLLCVCGTGPIRSLHVMNGILYVVSGNQLYYVQAFGSTLSPTLIGNFGFGGGPVSIIDNGVQIAIFDGAAGYVYSTRTMNWARQSISTDQSLTSSSSQTVFTATAPLTVTLAKSSILTNAWLVLVKAVGGAVTITPYSSDSINGDSDGLSVVIPEGQAAQISTDGSGAIILTLITLSGLYQIDLPFSGPVIASYQDGFGFVNVQGTNQWYQSNSFDLSTWDPLNFSSADGQPDDIVTIKDIHRQVYLIKKNDTEVWINAGLPGFAFQRLDGVFPEIGGAAQYSAVKLGEVLVWLGNNKQGRGQVILMEGYTPSVVSTAAVEREINSYPTIADATAYGYQQEGHQFYVITFPSGNATWCIDLTATRQLGVPCWHRRGALLNGQINRHWGSAYALFNETNILGDYLTGNLYAMDLDSPTDNGSQRKWVRSWRALSEPTLDPVKFSQLDIDMETGASEVPEGTDPQGTLRWSDDGGHNWSNERFQPLGATGETALRVSFKRLGSTRRNSGLDRIFELSSTDPIKVALIGANLR